MCRSLLAVVVLLEACHMAAFADVPQTINHQGVVHVNGVPFDGTGKFKFAILNASGVNVWTNDGSNLVLNGVPNTFEDVVVATGVYSVILGGTGPGYTMTVIDPSVFNEPSRRLRIWFDDGSAGVQQLTPDHALTGTPFAFQLSVITQSITGLLGIGTNTPVAKLHVRGDGSSHQWAALFESDNSSASSIDGTSTAIAIKDETAGVPWSLIARNDGDFVVASSPGGGTDFIRIHPNGQVGIGLNPNEKLHVNGNVQVVGQIATNSGLCCASDLRLKRDISPIASALAKVLSMRGVKFHWRSEDFPDRQFNDRSQFGFVAQELQEVLPEVVVELKDGTLAVDYGKVTPILAEGIKDLALIAEQQRCELDELRYEIEELRTSMQALSLQR